MRCWCCGKKRRYLYKYASKELCKDCYDEHWWIYYRTYKFTRYKEKY
ncbi:hypothetical protein BPS13_0057 [Bacillus phage BPS13]|uniref:Uncharacterized protein n=1 Tax=Bacillus phage BPS13 TaxID=1136731 RepID=J9PUG0_9CAUD|nr:hypothetical protein BPS13_0057 [Bacillus phage BPS13]AEZ50236.1 hypothetical protein BPS13_0057 [Bacillus phage BPS13]